MTRLAWAGLLTGLVACSGPGEGRCDGECVRVPEGWNGPVAVQTATGGAAAPDCGTVYTTSEWTTYGGLAAEPATCDCACDVPAGATVGDCEPLSTLEIHSNSDCGLPVSQTVSVSEGCTDFNLVSDSSYAVSVEPRASRKPVTCTPVQTADVPPPTWTEALEVCRLPDGVATCASGSCAPQPSVDADICIWFEGDLPCPGSAFVHERVTWQRLDDDRGCEECTCGQSVVDCAADVELYAGFNCGGVSATGGSDGQCLYVENFARAVSVTYRDEEIVCEPSTPTPTGGTDLAEPITLCCL